MTRSTPVSLSCHSTAFQRQLWRRSAQDTGAAKVMRVARRPPRVISARSRSCPSSQKMKESPTSQLEEFPSKRRSNFSNASSGSWHGPPFPTPLHREISWASPHKISLPASSTRHRCCERHGNSSQCSDTTRINRPHQRQRRGIPIHPSHRTPCCTSS